MNSRKIYHPMEAKKKKDHSIYQEGEHSLTQETAFEKTNEQESILRALMIGVKKMYRRSTWSRNQRQLSIKWKARMLV